MNLLLDTHIFIWAYSAPHKLTPTVLNALNDPANTLHLSVVSMWEMQIKAQIGKLHLPLPVKEFVTVQRNLNNIRSWPVLERHIWALDSLPMHHKDPFDRLLIAQAITENWWLVTADAIFAKYPVQILR